MESVSTACSYTVKSAKINNLLRGVYETLQALCKWESSQWGAMVPMRRYLSRCGSWAGGHQLPQRIAAPRTAGS